VVDSGSQNADESSKASILLQYVVQLHQEIDTEKRERDQLLNYLIVAFGGFLAVTFVRVATTSALLPTGWPALGMGCAAALLVIGLVYMRHQKLQQIADRWFTLYYLLGRSELIGSTLSYPLEAVVCKGLKSRRYQLKDLVFGWIVLLAICLQLVLDPPATGSWIYFIVVVALLAVMSAIVWLWGGGALKDPWEFKCGTPAPVDGVMILTKSVQELPVKRGDILGPGDGDCSWTYKKYE
jgi:cell division protein FtsW (lipid II flippase)